MLQKHDSEIVPLRNVLELISPHAFRKAVLNCDYFYYYY